MSDKLSALQANLKRLEEKHAKLINGEIVASEEEGEEQKARQAETISRTELFIRQVKAAIAKETPSAIAKTTPAKNLR